MKTTEKKMLQLSKRIQKKNIKNTINNTKKTGMKITRIKLMRNRKTKIECECGCVLQHNTLSKHLKTSKHQHYIKSNEPITAP